jgi:hypothetical protein
MARRTHSEHTDDDTGITSAFVEYRGTLSRDEASALQSDMQHVILGNTSVDYVIGDDERALREGRWTPDNAAELIAAIDHLRRCLRDDMPRETLAVAALRVGRLHTAATAKSQWPVVAFARETRTQRRKWRSLGADAVRLDLTVLEADVEAYRERHPTASNNAIARDLLPRHADSLRMSKKPLDALAQRIRRLPKKPPTK